MSVYFVILGAAVQPDGSASGSLRRRVEGAVLSRRRAGGGVFLATGGIGRHGSAEARVVATLLAEAGIAPRDILIEDKAVDTLESVVFCDRILRDRRDADSLVICTSRFHQPRCLLLFRMLGWRVRPGAMPDDLPHLGWRKWAMYVLKECVSTPYDALLLLTKIAISAMRRPNS